MSETWSAYLKTGESSERDWLLANRHATPAEYSTFLLFVETHPNPIDAIDATQMETADLIALIDTHTGPSAVHVTRGQAQEIYKLLMPQVTEPE